MFVINGRTFQKICFPIFTVLERMGNKHWTTGAVATPFKTMFLFCDILRSVSRCLLKKQAGRWKRQWRDAYWCHRRDKQVSLPQARQALQKGRRMTMAWNCGLLFDLDEWPQWFPWQESYARACPSWCAAQWRCYNHVFALKDTLKYLNWGWSI